MSVYRDLHADASPACYCIVLAVDVQTRWSKSSELPSSASTWESLGVEGIWHLSSVVFPSSCVLLAANWKGRLLGAVGSLWAPKLCVRLEGGDVLNAVKWVWKWLNETFIINCNVAAADFCRLKTAQLVKKAFCRHSDQSVDKLCLIEF